MQDVGRTRASSVVDGPRRSLFEVLAPAALTVGAQTIRGPGGLVLAALRRPTVARFDAPHAVVVMGGRVFGAARDGWLQAGEPDALGTGLGMAIAGAAQRPGTRTWVLLRASAFDTGATLEAMVAAARLRLPGLVAVVVGDTERCTQVGRLLQAAGWATHDADNTDPWSVLSGLDHVLGDDDGADGGRRHRPRALLSAQSVPVR